MYIPDNPNNDSYTISYPDYWGYTYVTCPCCWGSGVQTRPSDGLRVLCPTCNGTGKICQPSQPSYPQPIWYSNECGYHVTCGNQAS